MVRVRVGVGVGVGVGVRAGSATPTPNLDYPLTPSLTWSEIIGNELVLSFSCLRNVGGHLSVARVKRSASIRAASR